MNEGQVIGNYVVGREIGRGGMGVVHYATDSRLGRPVAIKALPEHLIADRERLARFDREARTLASISHPNIAGIYGVEEHEGRKYLVLEYVEGETLADRLDRGRLKVEDAIETCAQVAAGVEAAHEAGVVHRDLKPGNVKITPDGRVKVLDFGLAKTTEASSGASADGETVPLDRRTETVPGAVLGTAPYMSPEQARGRRVDQRSDVWSFGAVLYECLTGAGPFVGETVTDTLGAILHKDPEWSRLPKETPPTVQLLLRRCLQRDRAKRLHSIGDARIELEAAMEDPSGSALLLAGQALAARRARPGPILLALLGGAALLTIGAGAAWLLRPTAPAAVAHLGVPLPEGVTELADFALSPDGRTIAIVAVGSPAPDAASTGAIYVRTMTDREFTELAGIKDAELVDFSPSGGRIWFTRDDPALAMAEIGSIPTAGGPALTAYRGGTSDVLLPWAVAPLSDDSMLVPSRDSRGLFRLSASGGPPKDVGVKLPEGRLIWGIAPARGAFVLVSTISTSSSKTSLHSVNLDTGETAVLLEDASDPAVLDAGALAFLRGGTLFTAPFDLDRAVITGPVRAVVSGVQSFAVARSAGHLAYTPKRSAAGHGLVALDRSGVSENVLGSKEVCWGPVVSPEGRRIAYGQVSADDLPGVWVLDVTSRLARLISAKGEVAFAPCWTPDGRLAYVRPIDAKHMQTVVADLSLNTVTPLFGADVNANEKITYSPDGRHIILSCDPSDGREPGLYQADSKHPETIRPFFASPAWDGGAAFSPDGKWVAYNTSGSGRSEVYLRAFDPVNPESAPIHPVSREGGENPVWSRDGKELFFVGGPKSDGLFGATVETEPALKISEPRRILNEAVSGEFDVLPDGRFIFARKPGGAEARPDLRIILNWAQSQGERESRPQ